MKLVKVLLITGLLTLGVTAIAMASGKPGTVPPTSHPEYAPATPPGPQGGLPEQAKAYGRVCTEQGASKHHEAGAKGTEFSECVKNMAQAHKHPNMSARRVCGDESKKHSKGEESDFRHCVKGVVQLRREEHEHNS